MSSPRPLAFGFSPCPNDTFAFWAAVHDRLAGFSVRLEIGALADIETLNRRAVDRSEPPLAVTKLSLPALAAVTNLYAVLPAGAALGFGCGPLVVRRGEDDGLATLADLRGRRIAIPGRNTTAFLLFAMLSGLELEDCTFVEARFEQVMPLVTRGECDAGVIIHESRFTYAQHGLVQLADLGVLWERATELPLPLGVIAMRRDLGRELFDEVGRLLRNSVRTARRDPSLPREFVQAHSQEMAEVVCARHIALYVNDYSEDLGEQGRRAVDVLLARGRELGLLPAGRSPWWEASA